MNKNDIISFAKIVSEIVVTNLEGYERSTNNEIRSIELIISKVAIREPKMAYCLGFGQKTTRMDITFEVKNSNAIIYFFEEEMSQKSDSNILVVEKSKLDEYKGVIRSFLEAKMC